jgi:hypothetical protein
MAGMQYHARLIEIAKASRFGFTATLLTLSILAAASTISLAQMPDPAAAARAVDNGAGLGRCRSVAEITDRDGDFTRNGPALSSPNLCLMEETFNEGPLVWRLQIIQNKTSPQNYLWFVPHDNENVAFDTAVFGVAKHGGTVVAVETGGSRFNGPQDPNRNFDAGTGRKCPQQIAASPRYTAAVTKWRSNNAPVIALHSNERGYSGDGHGGAGGISILKPLPGSTPYPAPNPLRTRSPSDSIVFVASASRGGDPGLLSFIAAMNNAGLNVMREFVSARNNDCSFSNYATLTGIRKYVNVEVVHGDRAGQKKMLEVVLALMSGNVVRENAATTSDETPIIDNKRPPRKKAMAVATAKPAKKKLAKKPAKPQPVMLKPVKPKAVKPKAVTPKPKAKKPPPATTSPPPKQP